MATITRSRNYPVDRKEAFAYLTTPRVWPDYYSGVIAVENADTATFASVGDTVGFTATLLGRRMPGTTTLEEIEDGSLVRHTATISGLPPVHQTWRYGDTEEGMSLEVTMATDEADSFFGKAVDRFVVPHALQRDLERSLDKLEELFAVGIPDD